MSSALDFTVTARDGAARTGVARLAGGSFRTPCFMPVGTRGTVKALTAAQLEDLGYEVVLANTYHLMLRPGSGLIRDLGGIHRFSGWDGLVLSDSGGYQVFSLSPKVDDDGVTFRSTYDGSEHRLTPEGAVSVQCDLGTDIQMVLDVCSPLPSTPDQLRLALERTAAWAERARAAHAGPGAIFGIVQGGDNAELRAESARRTVAIGFDGYGIGGLSVGESREVMLKAVDAAVAELPDGAPRYLMGVGDPIGLVEAVARGVDMFDCVLPTRLGRHGTALTSAGRLSLRAAGNARDPGPIDPDCPCEVCARWSRAFIRHLLAVGEPTGSTLVSLHNLAWLRALVLETAGAIRDGGLAGLRARVASVWGGGVTGSEGSPR